MITFNDFLVVPSCNEIYRWFFDKMTNQFEYKDLRYCNWFLGMKINQSYNGATISQSNYLRTILDKYDNLRKSKVPTKVELLLRPLENVVNTNFPYCKICRQLRYFTMTKWDIEHA
jgi:hypothetical protein